jgi:hypothetical protein
VIQLQLLEHQGCQLLHGHKLLLTAPLLLLLCLLRAESICISSMSAMLPVCVCLLQLLCQAVYLTAQLLHKLHVSNL